MHYIMWHFCNKSVCQLFRLYTSCLKGFILFCVESVDRLFFPQCLLLRLDDQLQTLKKETSFIYVYQYHDRKPYLSTIHSQLKIQLYIQLQFIVSYYRFGFILLSVISYVLVLLVIAYFFNCRVNHNVLAPIV